MMILITKSMVTLRKYPNRNVGILFQPRWTSRLRETPRHGFLWAADNDAYSNFHEDRYTKMLDKCQGVHGCLFVTCPDVVGDADTTFKLYLKWARELLGRDLPLGYVGQDGATPDKVPWNGMSALFIGGTTDWKLGPEARELVETAKEKGKWVHMGRVNSIKRLEYAKEIGCDSIDGSSLSMYTDRWLAMFAEAAEVDVT